MVDYIRTKNDYATGIFNSIDLTEVNLLRRAILSEIETYAIEYVVFHINNSSRHDEILALKLGQLVIDHSKFDVSKLEYSIDVGSNENTVQFTSDDIKGLPITYSTPIAVLLPGQRIKCKVIITKGQAKDHVKWRPVSLITITEIRNGYFISSLQALRNSIQKPGKEFKDKYYFDTRQNMVREQENKKEKYYVDSIIIHQNNTTVKDEFLATSIGLLEIKNDHRDDEIVLRIRKEGPGTLMTIHDRYDVDFNYFGDIGYIGENQIIDCEIVIRWGIEPSFVRWKTVAYDYGFKANGYQFRFKNIGMLTTEEIFSRGLEKISAAVNREPITIFSQVRGKEKYGKSTATVPFTFLGEVENEEEAERLIQERVRK